MDRVWHPAQFCLVSMHTRPGCGGFDFFERVGVKVETSDQPSPLMRAQSEAIPSTSIPYLWTIFYPQTCRSSASPNTESVATSAIEGVSPPTAERRRRSPSTNVSPRSNDRDVEAKQHTPKLAIAEMLRFE
ncbi:hypothetical protein [Echinococcus multilocularis]|uniref:Uncharacterized protein n=1 Tax=Echinococcus multilocularis TaxID=6211 RepID=A0A068Y3D7_ECHMU|nr:hypothetical protein [Echinococcus multilocularis]